MINGRQTLSINKAKLVRMAIMQITRENKEFKPYIIKIKKFAELLNI